MKVCFSLVFVGIAALVVTGTVVAQQDVTVSATNAVERNGAVGGVTAYSFATTSCNIGNAVAIWIDNTNEHPLIGSQLYRLMDGRYEQIGMSWLKHSFCAVNENSCGNCQACGHGVSVAGSQGVGETGDAIANRQGQLGCDQREEGRVDFPSQVRGL